MHWPLQTWYHIFWHTDTNLSEKKDCGLLRYDTVSTGKWFCVFLRKIWHWFSGMHRSMICWSLGEKAIWSFATSESIYPATQYHIPEDWSPWLHRCHNFSALHCLYMTSHLPQRRVSSSYTWSYHIADYEHCCVWFRATAATYIIIPGERDCRILWNVNMYLVCCKVSHPWTLYLTNTLHSDNLECHISSPLFSTAL